MDKESAINLIKETFENSFDEGRFTNFINNLFNKITLAPFEYKGAYIPEAYNKYINKYKRIGKYFVEDKRIDILIVYLNKESSIERARSMQRNFIAGYLTGKFGSYSGKDAAVCAFVSPSYDDWRFSLVKMEYKLSQTKTGITKGEEDFTPARRYSFLVGKNEPNHTAQQQLLHILMDDVNNPTLEQLEKAFSVEKVTKEFLYEYRNLYLDLQDSINNIVSNDQNVYNEFEKHKVNINDFSKILLGQIVFLYFLQKKGWLGVPKDKFWGEGDRNFLRSLFNKYSQQNKNFFNDCLEILFYNTLNNPRLDQADTSYSPDFDCRIPFLNGGLFEPINNYDWRQTNLLLPNRLFSNKNETKEKDIGNGILDVFDRYNFTVQEDEPLEKEVALDPELLGKVFENLIEENLRKGQGAYYTPREIVHYMCQESLINYLENELEDKVTRSDLDIFIKHGEHFIEYEETAIKNEKNIESGRQKTTTIKSRIPENIKNNAKQIDDKLANIRVCDPAVGSGAFPVGMMLEIVKARNVLTNYLSETNDRTIYNFKRHCIENCLYGVDIDSSAVDIAKLRFWLSLVVDEEDVTAIKPLPNLDYKLVCGNSLSGVERDLFNNHLFKQLEQLKLQYFNETDPAKKLELKNQIDELIKEITNNNENFEFKVYFSEIFHEKEGFDVVIANPPYVSYGLRGGQIMTTSDKEFYKNKFPNSAEYKISLYAIFMDKAIQLCKPNGGLQTFIVPDSFLLGRYFSKIRKYILTNCEIIFILLLPYKVFDATVGFSVVYLFKKKSKINEQHRITVRCAINNETINQGTFKEYSYPQLYFKKIKYNRFRLFFDQKSMELVDKLEKDASELGLLVRFNSGLIAKNGKDSIISNTKKGEKWLKGIVSGREINRYVIFPQGYYLLYDKDKIKSGLKCVDYFTEKLFMRQTGDSLICAYDNYGLLALNNVHIGNLIDNKYSLKYIIAIINSKLLNYYYKLISLENGRVMAQIDIETLEGLPIKKITIEEQKPFIDLVDKILTITKDEDYLDNLEKQEIVKEYEHQIDQMVYKLYDLTEEEIKIVEDTIQN